MNRIGFLENLRQDILYASRGMRQSPVFAAIAIVILTLGIGGTTAMFTVVRAVLLKPLAYPDPQQLVLISGGATPVRFDEIKAHAKSFSGVAAYVTGESLTLVNGSDPEILNAARASTGFLNILGVSPILGRDFSPTDDSPGGAPVAMISDEVWNRRFHRDPRIIGQRLELGSASYTIVGVLPQHFQFPSPGVDVWLPKPSEWGLTTPESRRLSPFLSIFGRLRSGVSLSQAHAEMAVIHHQYASAHPAMLDAKSRPTLSLMQDVVVGGVRSALYLLFGVVSLVLLIVCANIASLLLTRANSRSREFAVRAALGAGRKRVIGQLLAESILLSCVGGALGFLIAWWSLKIIPALTETALPRAGEIQMDWTVLAFAACVSLATGLLFGLAPSIGASRPDLMRVLRTGSESPGRTVAHRVGLGDLLVVGQIAISVVLLIGAALLFQSVVRLRHTDLGFDPRHLFTAKISLPSSRYDTAQKKTLFFRNLIDRIDSLPGVRSTTAAMFLPMTGFVGTPVQDAQKGPQRLNERPIGTVLVVFPKYFHTLDIPLKRGRDFARTDTETSQRVAIINENLARRFWPDYPAGENPLGGQILIGAVNPKPAIIVGIVPNVHQNLENSAWPDTVYTPYAQDPQAFAMLAIRSGGDPLNLSGLLRNQVRAMDPHQAISDVRTMDQIIDGELGQRHLILVLLECFAFVALLLATTGVYGVISYSVSQRTHELGVRWALGADRGDILALVMSQGLGLATAGLLIGIAGALAITRVMKSFLFGISATDTVTFAGVALLFLLVAVLASYIPARRATRIDPMAALRT